MDGGEIYFKTDDDDLFRDSLEYFPASGYEITWKTFDLHENEPEWNIRTEHVPEEDEHHAGGWHCGRQDADASVLL